MRAGRTVWNARIRSLRSERESGEKSRRDSKVVARRSEQAVYYLVAASAEYADLNASRGPCLT